MANTDLLFSAGPPGERRIRVSALQREFLAITIWVAITFVQFPGDELLLYPLALYFAVRIWQQRVAMIELVSLSWPILLFPLWCLISPIWAVEPFTAFQKAIYLILTMMICYHVALNLTPRQIMYSVLLATGGIGVLNMLMGLADGGNFTSSLFSQKNRMGVSMVMLWIVSIATMIDSGARPKFRWAAVFTAALSGYMVSISDSATAMLLAIGTAGVCVLGALLLKGGFWRPSKLALTFVFFAMLAAAASIAISTFQGDPVTEVLALFGKDATLTGRTTLWGYAEEQIRERPLLGVGAGGFWRYQVSPLVRMIYAEFYKEPWHSFSFHNSYYETAVHQGLIGVGLFVPAILWAVYWLLRGALSLGSMPFIYFLSTASAVLVRSLTEADFYYPFVLYHMLIWIGALSAVLAMREQRIGPARAQTAFDRHA